MLELDIDSETRQAGSDTKQRKIELALILAICVVPAFLKSLWVWSDKTHAIYRANHNYTTIGFAMWQEATLIALLAYVLSRSGKKLTSFARPIELADLWRALILAVASYAVEELARYVLSYGYWYTTKHLLSFRIENNPLISPANLGAFLYLYAFIAINASFEELVVRAYVQSELAYILRNKWAPAIISIAIQAAYHLYQGVPNMIVIAAGFAVFAVYFARTGRVMPLIGAHFLLDLTALIYAAMH